MKKRRAENGQVFNIDGAGYCVIGVARDRSQIYAHRLHFEKLLGRKLSPSEVVHHKDGRKWNNCPFNLELMTKSEHSRMHDNRKAKR